jgi:hypothetical protein
MSQVFIVCPGRSVSGGPELCHQLADTLNADTPGRAHVVYYPFGLGLFTPAPYRRYICDPAGIEDITPGSTVVLPEVYGHLVGSFDGCDVVFWWMSVNNFYRSASDRADAQLADIRTHASRQLYQSEYARAFLHRVELGPVARLGDKLSTDYLDAIADPPTGQRPDVLVYNPAKGLGRSAAIVAALQKSLRGPPRVMRIENLERAEVKWVLSNAKVYIDFGEHPGKDRLPREAAALGCAVLTNRRGAAGNSIDVPIPEEFKIDDRKPRFERRVVEKIHLLLEDFTRQSHRFNGYRAMIAAEPAQFVDDARQAFPIEVRL